MKDYLKMSDVFCGDYHAKRIHDENGNGFSFMLAHCLEAEYAAHAINSHDELVEMNKELLAALEAISSVAYQERGNAIEMQEMADAAIAKAKVGAA